MGEAVRGEGYFVNSALGSGGEICPKVASFLTFKLLDIGGEGWGVVENETLLG